MTTEATEARPDWRQVNIRLLAGRLYAARMHSNFHNFDLTLEREPQHVIESWERVAEAAVDELLDKPDREFQAQLDAFLTPYWQSREQAEPVAASEWRAATAGDWL